MNDTTRAARPRLSIGRGGAGTSPKPCNEVRPAQTMPRTERYAQAERQPAPKAPVTASGGDRGLANVLDPVRAHFDLTDDKAAELAAFTRMLLSGGTPRGFARG